MYVLPIRLPIWLGMLASAVVALALCPVPRSTTLSAAGALFLALAYVLATAGIGAAVFAACGVSVTKRELEVPIRRVLLFFCCVAAWIAPLAAFYARDSLWAVLAGLVLSVLVASLIYRCYPASRTAEMLATSPESPSIDPHATRRITLTFAALLLQLGVLSTLASMAHSATILISCAIAISYLDRQTLPVAINAVQHDIPFSNKVKAILDSAFLLAYGLMYLGGGRLTDRLGTRRGFLVIMIFWSLACASHGLATNVVMLAASRLLLGIGEGGGFPAATRAVAEWFPVHERATAMGIINAGTGIGGIVAPPRLYRS